MSSTRQQTIVLFGAHRWNHERYIDDAQAAGLCVVLAASHGDKEGIGPSLEKRVHETFCMPSPLEPEELTKLVTRLNAKYGPSWHVLSFDDYVAEEAARLAQAANRPFLSPTAEEETRCKHLMRQRWNRFVMRHPELKLFPVPYSFRAFNDFADPSPNEIVESPGFGSCDGRFIVKPDELAGSVEVRRVTAKHLLDSTIKEVLLSLRDNWFAVGEAHGVRVRPRVQVELEIPRCATLQQHPHAEFSAEFLSEGGRHHLIGVTQKWISKNFTEVGHLFPASSFPRFLLDDLQLAVDNLLKEMGVHSCISHWEFIVTPDEKLALVETQMRPAGDRIMELVEHTTNTHPVRALLALLNGQAFDRSYFESTKVAAICYLGVVRPVGRIVEVRIDANIDCHAKRWWVDRDGLASESDWHGPTEWGNRHVSVITTGKDTDEVRARCYKAANCIILTGEKGETPLTVVW